MVCLTVKQIGTSYSQRNVLLAVSPWRRATGGSRRSTITTTVSASTARCARKTSKDRVSSPREDDRSARHTPANTPLIYNSDTVYSTTTFRPVTPTPHSPIPHSPHRTRKLETPLHQDGGLFSDIRSAEGKLLSTVTVDRVHTSQHYDVTDTPNLKESHIGPEGDSDYVDSVVKTETFTNEDVLKIKFTPVPPEISTPRTFTPIIAPSPIQYIKDDFKDLQSYKMVSLMNKLTSNSEIGEFNTDTIHFVPAQRLYTPELIEKNVDVLHFEQPLRPHTPLANLEVAEHLTKIDGYLQESLDACSGSRPASRISEAKVERIVEKQHESIDCSYKSEVSSLASPATPIRADQVTKIDSYLQGSLDACSGSRPASRISESKVERIFEKQNESNYIDCNYKSEVSNIASPATPTRGDHHIKSSRDVGKTPGVWRTIYNMPIHYHAAILCFILIIYSLIFQYIKENCHGKLK